MYKRQVRLNELFAAFDQTGRNIYHSGNDTVLRQDVEITFVVLDITIKNNANEREVNFNRFHVMNGTMSEKHAGFVVNLGSASSHDVHRLMRDVRKKVYEDSGIALEPEMIILPPDYRLEDKGPAVPLHFVSSPGSREDGQEQSGS